MSQTVTKPQKTDYEAEFATNGKIPDQVADLSGFKPDDTVLSCPKLESGLRLGDDAVRACCMGAIVSPMYWSAEEAAGLDISKDMLIEKRKGLFKALNDEKSGNISCKHCDMVKPKKFKDVYFTGIGHVNLAHFSMCNLRCHFCGFTQHNNFTAPQYDALSILQLFDKKDVEWDSFVDLNGGEPTLLKNLDEYIDYFASRGIRILLYTNAVRYSQAIYDGVKNGTITWLITSLDAGTPSSFHKIKGRDHFEDILENLTRYAKAGSDGLGNLAVKYIFSDDNCSDDDINGFAYAMLAIRPQKVWLTFDFFPLADLYEGQEEVGVYDYSEHVKAYTKMFLLLKKHGLEAAHFAKTHLAQVMQTGRDLIESVEKGIEDGSQKIRLDDPDLLLKDFRVGDVLPSRQTSRFTTAPMQMTDSMDNTRPLSLDGKKVLLAPAYGLTQALLNQPEVKDAQVLGFLDRNPVMYDKQIDGHGIFPYEKLPDLNPDIVLVASPEQHQADIVTTLSQYLREDAEIALYGGDS